jgi:hypothetical protein
MPNVRCPSCERLLVVEEDHQGQDARCPSCRTVFAIPVAVPVPSPASEPSGSPFAVGDQEGGDPSGPAAGEEESPFDFHEERAPLDRSAKKAVESAGRWLRAAVIFGSVGAVCCSCVPGGQSDGILFLGLFVVVSTIRLIPLLFIALGAHHLEKGKSYGPAVTGAVFALLVSSAALVILGGNVLMLFGLLFGDGVYAGHTGMVAAAAGSALFHFILIILAAMGGIKALIVLQNPQVKARFRK